MGIRKCAFIGEPPASDENVMAVTEYDEFYNYLIIFSVKHLDEHPEDKNKINTSLEK